MKLNCKPGDMAVVVGICDGKASDTQPNDYGLNSFAMVAVDIRGAVFKCLRMIGSEHWEVELRRVAYVGVMNDGRQIQATGDVSLVPDSVLRPLRPGEGDDETLTWAGKPEKVTT